MTERSWLDLSGFVYISLGEGACRQQLPPSQLHQPALCQEGRESWHSYCSLAQMPVCLHHSPLPLLVSLSDPTGVDGWGAGWGPGCLGLSLILFPMTLSTPLLLTSVPTPIVRCLSLFIKQAFIKCLCVLSDIFLCYVSGFGISVSIGCLFLSLLYLVPGSS